MTSTTDRAPHFPRMTAKLNAKGSPGRYPIDGGRLGPGWQRIWDHLSDGIWRTRRDVVTDPVVRGDLAQGTVENLLAEAVREGLIEVGYVNRPSSTVRGARRRLALVRRIDAGVAGRAQ